MKFALFRISENWKSARALLGFHVHSHSERPEVVFEVSPYYKIRLSVAGEPRFWVEDLCWDGKPWIAQDPTKPLPRILEPIHWQAIRKMDCDWNSSRWASLWASWFAQALQNAAISPLYPGSWRMGIVTTGPVGKASHGGYVPPQTQLPMAHSIGDWGTARVEWDDWFCSDGFVVPLRSQQPHDEGRVRAYRKLARSRTLPPALVLYCAVLSKYFVIDGHARIIAARQEGIVPRLIALWPVREDATVEWPVCPPLPLLPPDVQSLVDQHVPSEPDTEQTEWATTTRAWSISHDTWLRDLAGFNGKVKKGGVRPVTHRGWKPNPPFRT